jgi:hypothetical protein
MEIRLKEIHEVLGDFLDEQEGIAFRRRHLLV